MDDVLIRKMRMEDLEAVMWIERASNPMTWSQNVWMEELTKNQVANHVVACAPSPALRTPHSALSLEVVGFAGCWIVADEANIVNVAVHPEWRRRKIGERLMTELLKLSASRGVKLVTLEVRASNESAMGLYRKFGFTQIAIRKAFYQQPVEDGYVFWLNPIKIPSSL